MLGAPRPPGWPSAAWSPVHVPATVVYHAVPSALSGNKKLATAFERAWNTSVSPGAAVYAG